MIMLSKRFVFVVSLFFACALVGCQASGGKPANPFAVSPAHNTVPPPATFSSQEFYLGQNPSGYTPKIPAAVYPSSSPASAPSGNISPTPAVPNPLGAETTPKAEVFTAAKTEPAKTEPQWTAVEVPATSQTAFQAIEAKSNSETYNENGIQKTAAGDSSFVVGTSHTVTTIVDDSPAASPTEPKPIYAEGDQQ